MGKPRSGTARSSPKSSQISKAKDFLGKPRELEPRHLIPPRPLNCGRAVMELRPLAPGSMIAEKTGVSAASFTPWPKVSRMMMGRLEVNVRTLGAKNT